jgi:DNA-binding CsgD family transcriptional regulator
MSTREATAELGLVGRDVECSVLARAVEAARAGAGNSTLVRGEPGSGKTSLLRWTRQQAGGDNVVSGGGAESETSLAFAAVAQVTRPLLPLSDRLPAHQRRALAGALALGPADVLDPFAVYAAVLGVLTEAAADEPLVVLVDDCGWLDQASLAAFMFVSRRIERDPIVIVFAERSDDRTPLAGVVANVLDLEPLVPEDARALLRRTDDALAAHVERTLLDAAAGNPLALVEFPSGLSSDQRAGRASLPDPLQPGERLRQSFGRRIADISPHGQAALTVAAAADVEQAAVVESALGDLGIDACGLAELERVGLVQRSTELRFAHPIIRSVALDQAVPSQRRVAHRALARALGGGAADRRVWHAARGAEGADEQLATELQTVAEAARARTGHAAAAATFEEAARLSEADHARSGRLLAAATSWVMAGQGARAAVALAELAELPLDPRSALLAGQLEGRIMLYSGDVLSAHARLVEAAREAEPFDRELASLTYSEAALSCHAAGLVRIAADAADAAYRLAGGSGQAMLVATIAVAGTSYIAGDHTTSLRLLEAVWPALEQADPLGAHHLVQTPILNMVFAERLEPAGRLLARVVDAARAQSAAQPLCVALLAVNQLELRTGNWPRGAAAASEAIRLGEETGQHPALFYALCGGAQIDALVGDEAACRERAERAYALARGFMGEGAHVVRATPLAWLLLPQGRHEEVIDMLEPVWRDARERGVGDTTIWPWHADLFEAYLRSDRRGEAERFLADYEADVRRGCSATQHAIVERCHLLLGVDHQLDERFTAAMELHRNGAWRLQEARTQLCYGERLNRAGRRVDARGPLRSAITTFDRLGAVTWLQRASNELRASGEIHHNRRSAGGPERLTARELEVALAVADSRTNREVATALFLSLKTVEFHLRSVYRKLGIRSRTELVRALEVRDGAAPLLASDGTPRGEPAWDPPER